MVDETIVVVLSAPPGVVARGIAADISGTTIWRWLSEDAIRTEVEAGYPWLQGYGKVVS